MNYRIDMRYRGQMNEISLPWEGGKLDSQSAEIMRGDFEAHYRQRFGAGTTRDGAPLEFISFRVEAIDHPRLFVPFDRGCDLGQHERKAEQTGFFSGQGVVIGDTAEKLKNFRQTWFDCIIEIRNFRHSRGLPLLRAGRHGRQQPFVDQPFQFGKPVWQACTRHRDPPSSGYR
ncbi:MAG TPA: hypothetical protein EYQ81_08925 [Sneathiellales bacterium]|nr:hypothetical protein [Sneathiellales bacterium]